jgi:ABC-type transporter Mla subunit MlaD
MTTNTIDPRRPQRRLPGRERPAGEPLKRREGEAPVKGEAPLRSRPANENEPGTAAMIASLRRQPSHLPYYISFGISLLWVFSWSLVYSPVIFGQAAPFAASSLPQTMAALTVLILPIALVWIMAHFLWRTHQLRHVSEALMHSALRLLRPQDVAADGLASIAQAVRGDVDILVGGVEHAMQRASELEGIVHKEISAIERAFGGNEERIRMLVSGLENQRAALQQAGMVIGNEASPLLSRLETNTQSLDSIISTAQSTLARLEHGLSSTTVELARTIDEVASRASVAGSEISEQTAQMERTSTVLINDLRNFSQHLTAQVDALTAATGGLHAESSTFGQTVEGMEANLVRVLRSSVDELSAITSEIAHTVERVTSASNDEVTAAGTQMAELLQSASGNVVYHLKATSQEVAEQIEKSGSTVSQQIETSRTGLTLGMEGIVKD